MALKVLVGQIIMNEVIRYKGAASIKKCVVKSNREKWRILVMDKLAMRIVSACLRMHDLTEEGITLVEEILKEREPIPSMDAVYFITPSEESVSALLKDFEHPNRPTYRSAHVYFTNSIPNHIFAMLKNGNVVKHMKACTEINVAFIPYEEKVFSFDCPDAFKNLYSPNLSSARLQNMEQIAEQVATLCVTLEEYPAIRYRRDCDNNFELAQLIQQKLDAYKVDQPTMGKKPEKAQSQLLILDRGFDCVTPLLHELTLQAMIHDLLPVVKDVYPFVPAPNADEMQLLLDENDKLWVELRHQHIFAVSEQLNKKFIEFSQSQHMTRTKNQLDLYLQEVIRKAPQRQKQFFKYAKHIRLAEDCWRAYEQKQIGKLCSIEQDLAAAISAKGGKVDHMRNMYPILVDESISSDDKIRIIMLYVMLKNGISKENLRTLFEKANINLRQQDVVRNLKYLGINSVPHEKPKKTYPRVLRKERITEDTYQMSQWTPVIKDIMEQSIDNKLDTKHFPFLPGITDKRTYNPIASSARYGHKNKPPTEIKNIPRLIVFIVGGATFSEMRCAYEVNSYRKDWDVIVGSSHITTPELFIKDLSTLSKED